ncbi:hypothetical protein HY468_00510 [Candidatus Roizmanbacteria bacterium]|nr:hypothetical protein [Candidatus Roizmanbacteria bacterium]
MNRGILSLNQEEIQLISTQCSTTPAMKLFCNKLSSFQPKTTESVTIEISEEEVNTILDALGAPEPQEQSNKTTLRAKLLQFLMSSRT